MQESECEWLLFCRRPGQVAAAEGLVLRRRKFLQDDPAEVILRHQNPVRSDFPERFRIFQSFRRLLKQARLDVVGLAHQSRLPAFGFVDHRLGFPEPAPFLLQDPVLASQLPSGRVPQVMGTRQQQQRQPGNECQQQAPVRLQLLRIHVNTADT